MNRARERVRDDTALVGDVSSAVSRALGLDSTNRTLGRKVVIAALDANISAISQSASSSAAGGGGSDIGTDAAAANAAIAAAAAAQVRSSGDDDDDDARLRRTGEAAFRKAAKGYGALGDAMLSDVFGKVTTRLRGSLVQLQAMQEEEEDSDDVGGGGRAAKEEKEDGGGLAGFGKAERLSGFGVGRSALKGGLVKRHTFQVTIVAYCSLPGTVGRSQGAIAPCHVEYPVNVNLTDDDAIVGRWNSCMQCSKSCGCWLSIRLV